VIRIKKYSPPTNYAVRVKRKGERFLSRNCRPSASEFKGHAYWREIHDDLYKMSRGICAYCASWTPRTSSGKRDHTSVDHFIPRSVEPNLAYEWSNFRLCRVRLNQNKSDSLDVCDPVYIRNGWFSLDFLTFLMRPDRSSPPWVQHHVQLTIDCLLLNGNDYVKERIKVVSLYACDLVAMPELEVKYPFIAAEFVRQDFDKKFKKRMQTFFQRHI